MNFHSINWAWLFTYFSNLPYSLSIISHLDSTVALSCFLASSKPLVIFSICLSKTNLNKICPHLKTASASQIFHYSLPTGLIYTNPATLNPSLIIFPVSVASHSLCLLPEVPFLSCSAYPNSVLPVGVMPQTPAFSVPADMASHLWDFGHTWFSEMTLHSSASCSLTGHLCSQTPGQDCWFPKSQKDLSFICVHPGL